MGKDFLKNALIWLITFAICFGALLLVCRIPQSAIHENSRLSSEYFTAHVGFPVLLDGHANTRLDNYADCVLFNVIYNVDADRAVHSIITAPYYRIENSDAREDYASAVIDGKEPNNEYSRYWHGSQVFLRPLLLVASVEGIRLILFGLLAGLNAALAVLLLRRRLYVPALIYLAGLLLVQFWMTAFTIEYIMSFLVMTAVCMAVFFVWQRTTEANPQAELPEGAPSMAELRDKRMTRLFIVSGTVTCFLDFLTAETLTFTVPFILFLLLCRQAEQKPEGFRIHLVRLVKWGCAWLASYALMFGVKWALVYAVAGKSAFLNALENAAYRIEGDVALDSGGMGEAITAGQRVILGILRNLACLMPGSDQLTAGMTAGITFGVLALLAALVYLFRGERIDGAFIGILLLAALIPYLRYLCLSNHAYLHYFFTYRAQMAGIMALAAILAYSLKPSYILQRGDGGKTGRPLGKKTQEKKMPPGKKPQEKKTPGKKMQEKKPAGKKPQEKKTPAGARKKGKKR